jgi:hypothetical protein
MGWDPLEDLKKAGKKLDDRVRQEVRNVNKQFYDDMLGIEKEQADSVLKPGGIVAANRDRMDARTATAKKRAQKVLEEAKRARELPYILANQALAARRKKLASSSLLASGAQGGGSGGGMLATVLATGKNTLGA